MLGENNKMLSSQSHPEYPRKNQMKVLGISCSVRKGGNTEVFVKEALAGARDSGAETEFLSLETRTLDLVTGATHARKPVHAISRMICNRSMKRC